MLKGEIEYVSLDSACTLFWDIGCEPRNPVRPARDVLKDILCYLKRKGYAPKHIVDPLRLYNDIWREIEAKHPSYQHWHRYVLLKFLKKSGVDISESELEEIYHYFIAERAKWFVPVDHTRIVIERLVGKGYRLILTTATGAHDLPYQVLQDNELMKYFKIIYSTQLVGIPKRNPLFYTELADLLGADPARIVHIGDSIENDVLPARKAGLKTIYYGWKTLCRPADPQPCITTLTELLKIL